MNSWFTLATSIFSKRADLAGTHIKGIETGTERDKHSERGE